MKQIGFYNQVLGCKNEDEVFAWLIANLKPSNVLWSFFVNWDKVFRNTRLVESSLNSLNCLVGKEDFDQEFKKLLKQRPELAKVIPALIVRNGSRSNKFNILVDYKNKRISYEQFDFTKNIITDDDIETYLRFVKETGLKDLLISKKIKSLVDYFIGVEAGLDSNARKNRGGDAMEDIVEVFIKDFCQQKNYAFLKQADAGRISAEWDLDIPVDKSSRRYDFVINTGKELVIIETNFYGGGGSKLKSTAGEYRNLFDVLAGKFKFIWITDGLGWKTAKRPLRETFNHNDYVVNLGMIEKGILNFIV